MTTCNKCGSKKLPWITTWDCPNGCDATSVTDSAPKKTGPYLFAQSSAYPLVYYVLGTYVCTPFYSVVLVYSEKCSTYAWHLIPKDEVEGGLLGVPRSWREFIAGNGLDGCDMLPGSTARMLGLPEHPTKEQLLGK